MTESEFNDRAELTLRTLESAIDAVDAGIDCVRNGGVLSLELANGSKIVVNTQAPMRQIWVAARSGGHHFAYDGATWRDTRDGTELFSSLSRLVSAQSGHAVVLGDK